MDDENRGRGGSFPVDVKEAVQEELPKPWQGLALQLTSGIFCTVSVNPYSVQIPYDTACKPVCEPICDPVCEMLSDHLRKL